MKIIHSGIMSGHHQFLTTCGDTDDEWCAQRGGGIGHRSPDRCTLSPERRIYQHARILAKGDHNDATAEEVTGPAYLWREKNTQYNVKTKSSERVTSSR